MKKIKPIIGIENNQIKSKIIIVEREEIEYKSVNGRNLDDFITDLIVRGRTKKQIKIIARNTLWHHRIPEIRKFLKKNYKKIKKRFPKIKENPDNINRFDNNLKREQKMPKILTLKKKTLIKVFMAIGYKLSNKWSDAKLNEKLVDLPEIAAELAEDVTNEKLLKVIKKIKKADLIKIGEVNKLERASESKMSKKKSTTKKKKAVTKKKVTAKKTSMDNPEVAAIKKKQVRKAKKKDNAAKKISKKKTAAIKQEVKVLYNNTEEADEKKSKKKTVAKKTAKPNKAKKVTIRSLVLSGLSKKAFRTPQQVLERIKYKNSQLVYIKGYLTRFKREGVVIESKKDKKYKLV